jgi:hypothetical protein
MRTVAPIEYTVLCPNCKTRYACGITEYHQNLGNFFVCACNTQIKMIDAELVTWQTVQITDGELVFKQLTYEG